ncbi:MAG: TIGR03435 family protein, partial [Edaphobacter sp.]
MTNHPFCALVAHQKSLLIAAVWIVLAIPGFAQANIAPQATGTRPPAYDVISVKRSKPEEGMQVATKPDSFSARNVTLWALIYNAYSVRPADPVKGLPGWASSTRFDVEAKMDDSSITALQKLPPQQQSQRRRLMLQSLLADRFQLRTHHETVE